MCDWRQISIYIIPGLFGLAFFILLELSFFCQLECVLSLISVLVWGDPGVDGRIILGWIFGKWDVGVWTGWS